jgi:hypothetical protein
LRRRVRGRRARPGAANLLGARRAQATRLTEVQGRLAEALHTWVEWACSQLLQNTPSTPSSSCAAAIGRAGADAGGRVAHSLRGIAPWAWALPIGAAGGAAHGAARAADYPPPPSAPEERPAADRHPGGLGDGRSTHAGSSALVEDAPGRSLDARSARVLAEQGAAVPLMLLVTCRPSFARPGRTAPITVITLRRRSGARCCAWSARVRPATLSAVR